MLLVAFGVLPLMVVSVACGATFLTPASSIANWLRCRSCIDDFDEELVRCIVTRDRCEDARRSIGERRWDNFSSEMSGEHDLRPVAGRAVAREGVVTDEVGRPLHAAGIDVDEERRVAGHDDQIAVALKSCEPGSVSQCGLQVRRGVALARGPLADKNLGPIAVGGVIVVRFRK